MYRILVVLAVLFCSACAHRSEQRLTIAAAASLRNVFEALKTDFEQETGLSLHFSFAASGVLRLQIEQGAPFDVFASAALDDLDRLNRTRQIAEPVVFARNQLALVKAHSDMGCQWPLIEQIAIGNPKTVPAGLYARQALAHQTTRPDLELIYTEHAGQIVAYLQTAAVPYGIVYQSDVHTFKLRLCHRIQPEQHDPIVLASAVLRNRSAQVQEQAQQWHRYLRSSAAQKIFKQYGFLAYESDR